MCKILLLLLICVCRVIHAQEEVGDACEINDNESGVCDYVNNCEYAANKIHKDKTRKGVEICFYENRTPVICCPHGDRSHQTGPYSQHFENCENDVITNKDTVCRYKGDLPVICCPKTPDYAPIPEPEGCLALPPVKTPDFKKRSELIAWHNCIQNRQYAQMCEANERFFTGYSRTSYCNLLDNVPRISSDDPANSAASLREFPHMAVVGCNNNIKKRDAESLHDIVWVGGGSLISERYILTAAHVLSENTHGPLRYAMLGVLNKKDIKNGALYYIVRRIPYKTYVSSDKHDDIALLELHQQVKFSEFIYPICLPVPGLIYDTASRIVAGWGRVGYKNDTSDILLKAYVNEVVSTLCQMASTAANYTWDERTMICAASRAPPRGRQYSDSCEGDSGGPLMTRVQNEELTCTYVITGVVSWGPKCGTGGSAVYTRVAPYVDWIVRTIWPVEE